jgi:lysophospholipase L1-like esterase
MILFMKKRDLAALIIWSIAFSGLYAQEVSWWNPANGNFPVIEGQAWPGETETLYDRLPARAKGVVREAVWSLSKQSSGLVIRFRTNAEQISVRYTVSGSHAMEHMPATGVSGMDLYAIDSDGQWKWSRGERQFSDTITYDFQGLQKNDQYHNYGREYRLYLPLYNHVKWLEIGVLSTDLFSPLPVRQEKPIVVYGTSIAHGACASRPGMSWANILSRKMDRPLINLGFSGNGRLEPEVTEFLTEIEPKIYVIDCLPNLWNAKSYPEAELKKRIKNTVNRLKEKRPHIPILLVEHAGYTDGALQPDRKESYTRVNKIQKETYLMLLEEGITGVHYLSNDEINLQLDDMVDGTHPNDLGMMHYAEAYEKKLRKILNEPIGTVSTTRPCTQYREPDNYDWELRHRTILEMNRESPPEVVFIANSIVHFWGGLPKTKIAREQASWDEIFTPKGVRNFAYGWDRLENVLWRIYHGELDGFQAKKVVVMIGTNNLHLNTDDEILQGLELIVTAIKTRQVNAQIILMGILPRRGNEVRVATLNQRILQLAVTSQVKYRYIGDVFLGENKKLKEELFSDGLHPNKQGYELMREPLREIIED